jgi:broad specificity phosphatase PhoE
VGVFTIGQLAELPVTQLEAQPRHEFSRRGRDLDRPVRGMEETGEGRVQKLRRLSQAVDRIRERYGDEAIRQALLVTLYRSITMKMEGFNEQHG